MLTTQAGGRQSVMTCACAAVLSRAVCSFVFMCYFVCLLQSSIVEHSGRRYELLGTSASSISPPRPLVRSCKQVLAGMFDLSAIFHPELGLFNLPTTTTLCTGTLKKLSTMVGVCFTNIPRNLHILKQIYFFFLHSHLPLLFQKTFQLRVVKTR